MGSKLENGFFEKTKRGRGHAKHAILKACLGSWFPTLGQTSYYGTAPLVYIDGFAGPGKYMPKGLAVEEVGSPLVAYNAAADHRCLPKFKKNVILIFVEKNPNHARALEALLNAEAAGKSPEVRAKVSFEVICGEFADELRAILDREDLKMSPMLVFADPFGYKAVPNKLLQELLARNYACGQRIPTEVFITVMDNIARRFISDARKASAITELMGHDSNWHHLCDEKAFTPAQRRYHFIELFIKNLCSELPDARSLKFSILDKQNKHVYHLVHVAAHSTGTTQMKKAMWQNSQLAYDMVFSEFCENRDGSPQPKDKEEIAAYMAKRILFEFRGATVSGTQIEDMIIDEPVIHLNFINELKPLLRQYQKHPEIRRCAFKKMEYVFPAEVGPEIANITLPATSAGTSNLVYERVETQHVHSKQTSKKRKTAEDTETSKKLKIAKDPDTPKKIKPLKEPKIPKPPTKRKTAAAGPGTPNEKRDRNNSANKPESSSSTNIIKSDLGKPKFNPIKLAFERGMKRQVELALAPIIPALVSATDLQNQASHK